MKKIETLDSLKSINENKLTNEELLDVVHKLGYDSIDDIKKEKSKLAKLEALFNELNTNNNENIEPVKEEETSDNGESSTSDEDQVSNDTNETDEKDEKDTTPDSDADTNSNDSNEKTPARVEKPNSMHIKTFAEFCGETEENEQKTTDSDTMNESEIKTDEEFEQYAMDRMKQKHPNDFDENTAKKVIEDLKKKYEGNYGAMVGALR